MYISGTVYCKMSDYVYNGYKNYNMSQHQHEHQDDVMN